MFEGIHIPSGCTIVPEEQLTALQESGARSSTLFFLNDTIEVGDTIVSQQFVNGEKTHIVYRIEAKINGRPKFVTMSSFRRFPKDSNEMFAEFPLMRELSDGNDLDRYRLIKNRTFKVAKVVSGEAIDWDNSNSDAGDYKYKTSKFACLQSVDAK